MSLPNPIVDARGNGLSLGKELGRGGEGAVYEVNGRPESVAKVYLKPLTSEHAAKLATMASMTNASSTLLKIAALPTEVLNDAGGRTIGFLMPRVNGHKPIFNLYNPKRRLQEFPKADWRFLIHAATNTARAFSTVHATGLVIGDVNHGNLVVANDATVQIIDCDSFQVSSSGETYFCTVGVGTHQPPEMQGRTSYAGITRTANYDQFGLAVIIFQLLCMNRHPFSGRFLGKGEPPTIEEAIAGSRYAYSRDHTRTQMNAPPGSLPITALTPEIQELFEEAFAPTAPKLGRPHGERWVSALGALASDLKSCGTNRSHFYRRGLSACPWCAIEAASGATLFPVIFVPNAAGAGIGMAALWQEVGRIAEPPLLSAWPPMPAPAPHASPKARQVARRANVLKVCGWGSVVIALATAYSIASPDARALLIPAIGIIAFIIHRHHRKSRPGEFQNRLSAVKQDWEALRSSWTARDIDGGFLGLRATLSNIKASYDALPGERARQLQKLHEQQREKQLEEHLDRFFLTNTKISGIGPAKVATLASYGIDTAADVIDARVLAVPGFGDATLAKLKVWRRTHEQSFRFDPARGVSAADTAIVDRDILAKRTKLEQEMKAGIDRLRTVAMTGTNHKRALEGRLAELKPKYEQALADGALSPDYNGAAVKLMILSGVSGFVAIASAPALKAPASAPAPPTSLSSGASTKPERSGTANSSAMTIPTTRLQSSATPLTTALQTVPSSPPANNSSTPTSYPAATSNSGGQDESGLQTTLDRLRRQQASSDFRPSDSSNQTPMNPLLPSVKAGSPQEPSQVWPHQTVRGIRWRIQRNATDYMLKIEIGPNQISTVRVAPQFLDLDLPAMNMRVDHARDTISSEYPSYSGTFAYARDGTITPER